ncbi:Schwannomin-interacting protein 1 like, partial [Pseudolycoriella hygida]
MVKNNPVLKNVRSLSSSFCPSLESPEPEVKYPRGIINPNYPGFQHLAHTLAEHFVDHHFDQSDSEVSEFEADYKTASDTDNGNNNTVSDDLDKVEGILKGVFQSKESPLVESNLKFESELYSQNVIDPNDMKDKHVPQMKDESKVKLSDKKRLYSTPDILIKNNSFEDNFDFTDISEKPDILKNVFASDVISDPTVNSGKSANHEAVDKSERNQWSITPIDIVGNFEQEVEHEFGLIVSGYKSASSDDEMCVSVKKQADEDGGNKTKNMHEKMTDAVLSNAKETINTTIGECAHDQLKLNSENCSINDDADAHPHETSCAERQIIAIKSSTHSIPTAIVKPKYQRTSYDDRQLPPVVSIDREKPWYDNCTVNNNTVTHTPNKKIQQLPHFERKHKKHRSGNRTNSGPVSEKEKYNSMLLCEKDMDSASVAVVPPRKKDKIEQVDVYGNGDKGIKCSTIQKNHSNLSNNNNSINCSNNNNNVVYRKGNTASVVKENRCESLASFDVYNIETALPVIDLEAIENHLKAAKEEERRVTIIGEDDPFYEKLYRAPTTAKHLEATELQSKINLTKRNRCVSEKENNAPGTVRQMLDDFLPNRKKCYTPVNQNDEFSQSKMFPRVAYADDTAWGPVDLAPKEKFVEEMDNVIDKFIRVIGADNNETVTLKNSNKRNDREEIRRRLAMGSDYDYFGRTHSDRPTRKPSLHSRLQG